MSHLWLEGAFYFDVDSLPKTFMNLLSPFVCSASQQVPPLDGSLQWGRPAAVAAHQAAGVGAACQRTIHRCHPSLRPHCQGPS